MTFVRRNTGRELLLYDFRFLPAATRTEERYHKVREGFIERFIGYQL